MNVSRLGVRYCRSGEEQSHKSPTPGDGPDEYRRAVKSILIYLENTYGPMTSALTLSASKRSASFL